MSGRRDKRGGGGHGGGGEERWLLTYADMITLLLALFIVMFAMSSVDAKKFDNLRRSLSQTFNGQVLSAPGQVLDGSSGVMDPNAANERPDASSFAREETATDATSRDFARELKGLEKLTQVEGLDDEVEIAPSQRGIVVSLQGDAFFASGSSALKPGAEQQLARIARSIRQFGHEVSVEGHTDAAPLNHDGGFVDNRELSTERANSVVRYLEARGVDPASLSSVGYGEHHPKVDPPAGDLHRSIAANRRVEIVLLAPGADLPTIERTSTAEAAPVPVPQPGARAPEFGTLGKGSAEMASQSFDPTFVEPINSVIP